MLLLVAMRSDALEALKRLSLKQRLAKQSNLELLPNFAPQTSNLQTSA